MHFTFVDRVLELQPGVKITTVKCLSLAEEYLGDHFPRFPVMPGVLMLQAMTDASALLIGATEDFKYSMVTLKEARNVRFAGFVEPGRVLTVTSELVSVEEREAQFKTQGMLSGRVAVSGRLVLERYDLSETRPELAPNDAHLKQHFRARLALLYRPEEGAAATNGAAPLESLSATSDSARKG